MTPTPAAGEIPASEHRSLARRIGAAICAPSGFVLALCFVLPTVDACDKVQYPYQFPVLAEPYLFGLTAAVLAGFFLLRSKPLPRKGAVGLCHFTLLSIAAYGFFFFMEVADHLPEVRQPAIYLAIASVPAFAFLLAAVVKKKGLDQLFGRTLWTGGAISLLWFFFWYQDSEFEPTRVYFGLYLSLLTSGFLILSGALLEWGARGEAAPARGPPGSPI